MKSFNDETHMWEPVTPQTMPPKVILGLSIGTKQIGIALENDRSLLDWRTRSFAGHWSDRKLKAILRYIDRFAAKHKVEAVAFKAPHPSYHSDGLTELIQHLSNYLKEKQSPVYRFTVYDLKSHYRGPGTFRETLMSAIVKKRPELTREYHKEIKYRKKYYTKMFEAVACIHLAQELWEEGRDA